MTVVRRESPILALLCSAILLAAGAASTSSAAEGAKPANRSQASGGKATVAQGGKVELAVSAMTKTELGKLRPGFEALKPRVRSNVE